MAQRLRCPGGRPSRKNSKRHQPNHVASLSESVVVGDDMSHTRSLILKWIQHFGLESDVFPCSEMSESTTSVTWVSRKSSPTTA